MQLLADGIFWSIELLERVNPGYGISAMIEYQPTAKLVLSMPWNNFIELFYGQSEIGKLSIMKICRDLFEKDSKFAMTECSAVPDMHGFGSATFWHYGLVDQSKIEAEVLKLIDELCACRIEATLCGE